VYEGNTYAVGQLLFPQPLNDPGIMWFRTQRADDIAVVVAAAVMKLP